MLSRQVFRVLTSAGGAFTDTGPFVEGDFYAWAFVRPAGENAYDTGATLDLISVKTGITIAHETASGAGPSNFIKFPRRRENTDTGAVDTGPAMFPLAGDQIRLVISSGGNAQQGEVHVWITDQK